MIDLTGAKCLNGSIGSHKSSLIFVCIVYLIFLCPQSAIHMVSLSFLTDFKGVHNNCETIAFIPKMFISGVDITVQIIVYHSSTYFLW